MMVRAAVLFVLSLICACRSTQVDIPTDPVLDHERLVWRSTHYVYSVCDTDCEWRQIHLPGYVPISHPDIVEIAGDRCHDNPCGVLVDVRGLEFQVIAHIIGRKSYGMLLAMSEFRDLYGECVNDERVRSRCTHHGQRDGVQVCESACESCSFPGMTSVCAIVFSEICASDPCERCSEQYWSVSGISMADRVNAEFEDQTGMRLCAVEEVEPSTSRELRFPSRVRDPQDCAARWMILVESRRVTVANQATSAR